MVRSHRWLRHRAATWGFALLIGCLGTVLDACAQAGESDWYVAQVPARDQTEQLRAVLLATALEQVLVKVTGDPKIVQQLEANALATKAAQMLRSFSYRQDVGYAPDGQRVAGQYLVAEFAPQSVHQFLKDLKRAPWKERPVVLVWLLINDGAQQRLARADEIAALWALTEVARQRGIDLVFPDRQTPESSPDLRLSLAQLSPAVMKQAPRYGAQLALLMGLERLGTQWVARYHLTDGYKPMEWSGRYPDANQALREAGLGLATRLTQLYAGAADVRAMRDYTLVVHGVRSAEDYGRILAYLSGLPAVDALRVEGADQSSLQLGVRLGVDPNRLRQMLLYSRLLEFDHAADAPQPSDAPQTIALKMLH